MIQKALTGFFKNGSENGSTKKVKGKRQLTSTEGA
jgi:hypothetical protein